MAGEPEQGAMVSPELSFARDAERLVPDDRFPPAQAGALQEALEVSRPLRIDQNQD
jgi:hypothetical protein